MIDCVLCFDFGAGSGRLMAVFLKDGAVSYREIHRFANEPLQDAQNAGELCWQTEHWLAEMSEGLRLACTQARQHNWQILSIGIDTWGVDMAYFGRDGQLLQPPYCYRSERTLADIEEIHARAPLAQIYASGGNAYFPFNSIYQLYHDIHKNTRLGRQLAAFIFTPDFLIYLLSGQRAERTAEYCIASTSGLCDARQRNWNWQLIEQVGLPKEIFPPIVEAPYLAGQLAQSFGPAVPLLKVASHDTAAASASIDLDEHSCFLICGTWFILGIEAEQPSLSEAAFAQNIVNEGGALRMYRVQKLFCGFWLLQQLVKEWSQTEAVTYRDLPALAKQSQLTALPEFDGNDESLVLPDSMEQALSQLLGRSYPRSDLLKIVYRNMARSCARHLDSLKAVCGKDIRTIHAVGGGRNDEYFIAELQRESACQIVLGPVEASVLGNAALQFLYHKKVGDITEYRRMV